MYELVRIESSAIGKYVECYAKMEFISYRYYDIDDHRVDFVVKAPNSTDFYWSNRRISYAFEVIGKT